MNLGRATFGNRVSRPPPHERALVELAQLEEEKAKQAKAAAGVDGKAGDPELLERIGVVRDGIYKRLKLLATWADLDDEQV